MYCTWCRWKEWKLLKNGKTDSWISNKILFEIMAGSKFFQDSGLGSWITPVRPGSNFLIWVSAFTSTSSRVREIKGKKNHYILMLLYFNVKSAFLSVEFVDHQLNLYWRSSQISTVMTVMTVVKHNDQSQLGLRECFQIPQ